MQALWEYYDVFIEMMQFWVIRPFYWWAVYTPKRFMPWSPFDNAFRPITCSALLKSCNFFDAYVTLVSAYFLINNFNLKQWYPTFDALSESNLVLPFGSYRWFWFKNIIYFVKLSVHRQISSLIQKFYDTVTNFFWHS